MEFNFKHDFNQNGNKIILIYIFFYSYIKRFIKSS